MNLNKILEFHFSGANAVMAVHETLTAGMVGKKIMFKFTPEWDSLNKTIVYMAGDIVRAVPYKDENVIHPDVLAKPGVRLFVGAFGESADDELVIPTIFARGPEVHLGTDPLDAPVDPEPISMYCRLLAQIGDLGDLKTEAKKSLVAAINEVARDVSVPTKVSAFENDAGYLTADDLGEYGTDIDLSGYAKTEDIPTKLSQLANDKKYITEADLEDYDAETKPLIVEVTHTNEDGEEITNYSEDEVLQAFEEGRDVYFGNDGILMPLLGSAEGSTFFTAVVGNNSIAVILNGNVAERLSFQYAMTDEIEQDIRNALAAAKNSGEFKGDTGPAGPAGRDGVDGYTPQKNVDYFDGKDGQPGENGVSATHSWNGTVLTVTSASGTSSADLKGEKGDKGDSIKGDKGDPGAAGKTAYQYAKDGGYAGTEAEFAVKLAKEFPTKLSEFTNDSQYITASGAPVQSVNGETGAVRLTASDVGARSSSWMPTANQVGAVPVERTVNGKALSGDIALNADDVGARPETWMPTHSDVGAEKSGTAASVVGSHNTNTDAHNDIRLLITGLATRLDALANSDDETLDQMAEVVAYIKANRDLIEQITTGKISYTDIVNNLTTNVNNKPLSAAQGVALKALIDAITVPTKLSELTNDSGFITGYTETDPTVPSWAKASTKPSYTKSEVGLGNVDNVKQYSANNPPPYPVTSVNGKTGAVTVDVPTVPTNVSAFTNDAGYYSAANKQEMANAVIEQLPKYNGGVS